MSILRAFFLEEFHRGGSTEQCEELLDDWEELTQPEVLDDMSSQLNA